MTTSGTYHRERDEVHSNGIVRMTSSGAYRDEGVYPTRRHSHTHTHTLTHKQNTQPRTCVHALPRKDAHA